MIVGRRKGAADDLSGFFSFGLTRPTKTEGQRVLRCDMLEERLCLVIGTEGNQALHPPQRAINKMYPTFPRRWLNGSCDPRARIRSPLRRRR